MAKKYNADDVFKNFMSVDKNEDVIPSMTESITILAQEKNKKDESALNVTKEELKLKQRSYYLTDELLKAITIKTSEGILDKSGVVREALTLYLADILNKY